MNDVTGAIARVVGAGGHYVVLVSSAPMPRYAYTVGAAARNGSEFCLAGAIVYSKVQAKRILDAAAEASRARDVLSFLRDGLEVPDLGRFDVVRMEPSWVAELMLAAREYHRDEPFVGLQLVPDAARRTVDVPDTAQPRSAVRGGPWGWRTVPWRHAAPATSLTGVDHAALRGAPVRWACRWEEDYFEVWSDRDAEHSAETATVVPLALVVGADESLSFVADLRVGERAELVDGTWERWMGEVE